MKPKMMTHYLGVLLALARPLPLPVAVADAVNAALPEAVGKKVQQRRQVQKRRRQVRTCKSP